MRTATLISLGIGGVGTLTGASVAISYLYGGEIIKSHIENSNKSKNKIFISSKDLNLEDIKAKYETSKDEKRRPKPKKDGKIINKDNLIEWCEENVNSKFKDEKDSTYLSVFSWCFLNPKTIADEMSTDNREIYSSEGASGQKWQEAWNKYNSDKTKLRISDSGTGLEGLNGSDAVAGAKAIHKWCDEKSKDTKKLYEDGMEETYELFKEWCTKKK